MKPQEILSMIEEAAGTSLYESKKQSALKTIDKKDTKLVDINKILNEELSPTLGWYCQLLKSSKFEICNDLYHFQKSWKPKEPRTWSIRRFRDR